MVVEYRSGCVGGGGKPLLPGKDGDGLNEGIGVQIFAEMLDVGTRNFEIDEALGLNCAWYADILMTLTKA